MSKPKIVPAAAAEEATVEITRLVYGGDGLARRDGKAVFVPLTLPGERARVALVERHSGYDRARLLAVETPSPRRVAPGCEYFARCGGCQWQHAPAEDQAQLKIEILRETLRRTGGIAWSGPIALHAASPWGYRNRVRLRFSHAAAGPRLGYFARDSRDLVPVERCPIAAPVIQAAIAAIAPLPPPPESLREVEILCDAAGDFLSVEVEAAAAGVFERAYARELLDAAPSCRSLTLATPAGREVIAGEGGLEYAVGARRYWVAAGAFFQANRFLLDELLAVVAAPPAAPSEEGRAVDLFSGVGFFALPLAERFAAIAAVEHEPAAVASLRRNLAAAPGVRVHDLSVAEFMDRSAGPLDLLVADPPRAGLGAALVAAIAAARPGEIRYVSCDPATLARDLKQLLAAAPYRLDALHLFDLFPQTFHLETVALLHLEEQH
ncbi:MAG: class I SAM-dependent RNA methyltransferase [Terriglobales bacterium]